jgi:hypothetical protein
MGIREIFHTYTLLVEIEGHFAHELGTIKDLVLELYADSEKANLPQ